MMHLRATGNPDATDARAPHTPEPNRNIAPGHNLEYLDIYPGNAATAP